MRQNLIQLGRGGVGAMTKDQDLMLRAAWAHFIEGRTQDAVASELGLTRAKTNRLISECRELGLVRIGIDSDARIAVGEERALKERFGLVDVWVVPRAESEEAAVRTVGIGAGAYVSDHLGADETLAIGWGRTLSASVAGVQPRKAQGNRVVTLLGGMVRGNGLNSFDIASRYARTLSGECCYLIAPRVAESAAVARALLKQAHVREALSIAAAADVALIGIDDLSGASTLSRMGQFGTAEYDELRREGAVSILQGVALGRDGNVIAHPIAARTVGLDPKAFGRIPRRIVAASGARKTASIRAILKGGHCNVLITDEPTAEAVLALDR